MSGARPGIPGRNVVAARMGTSGMLDSVLGPGMCIDWFQDFPSYTALQTKCLSQGRVAHRPLGLATLIHASSFLRACTWKFGCNPVIKLNTGHYREAKKGTLSEHLLNARSAGGFL